MRIPSNVSDYFALGHETKMRLLSTGNTEHCYNFRSNRESDTLNHWPVSSRDPSMYRIEINLIQYI